MCMQVRVRKGGDGREKFGNAGFAIRGMFLSSIFHEMKGLFGLLNEPVT